MLLACVVVWSINVSVVKVLLRYWTPFSLASVRMLIALAGFSVVLRIRETHIGIASRHIWRVAAAGIFGIFLNQACFGLALKDSHASSVALLLAMIPVFVALISAAISVERFTVWSLIGLPVSLMGVFVIIATQPGTSLSVGSIQGNAFALGTAFSWAMYTVLLQPLLREYSVARISFWAVVVGLIGLLGPGIADFQPGRVLHEPWWAWLFVFYSALGAIFTTNFLWYLGTHRLGPARGSLYAFLQPFLGVLVAIIALGDMANGVEILGGGIVIGGIIIARRRKVAPGTDKPALVETALEPPTPDMTTYGGHP